MDRAKVCFLLLCKKIPPPIHGPNVHTRQTCHFWRQNSSRNQCGRHSLAHRRSANATPFNSALPVSASACRATEALEFPTLCQATAPTQRPIAHITLKARLTRHQSFAKKHFPPPVTTGGQAWNMPAPVACPIPPSPSTVLPPKPHHHHSDT